MSVLLSSVPPNKRPQSRSRHPSRQSADVGVAAVAGGWRDVTLVLMHQLFFSLLAAPSPQFTQPHPTQTSLSTNPPPPYSTHSVLALLVVCALYNVSCASVQSGGRYSLLWISARR